MANNSRLGRVDWLKDEDELPHPPGEVENWSENYLWYVWSPFNEVGIYFHLCRLPGEMARWDELMFVALPDGRWLVSKSISPHRTIQGIAVNAVEWVCEKPFEKWTKYFRGAAQILTSEELASGAVRDGYHIPVEMEMSCEGMSATYDFGSANLDQAWATGHYEQHVRSKGVLRYGNQTLNIEGTGLRDHSWGPRDYSQIGNTTWLHAQFPESGRSLMAVRVTGVPPSPEFTYAITCDRQKVYPVTAEDIPMAKAIDDVEENYEFGLVTDNGEQTKVQVEILRATRCSFHGPAQLILGQDNRAITNHDYVDAFARFEWDGEVGYGISERSIDHYPGAEPPPLPEV